MERVKFVSMTHFKEYIDSKKMLVISERLIFFRNYNIETETKECRLVTREKNN